MHALTKEPTLSRGDTVSIWAFMLAGTAIAATSIASAAIRIIELTRNSTVMVQATFDGTMAAAPIGPGGATAEVELQSAFLTVDSLPTAAVVAGIIEAVTLAGSIVIAVIGLTLLSRELIRGRIFSPKNTTIAATTGISVLIGYTLSKFFGNMVANAAFADISEQTFNNVLIVVDFMPLLLGAFVAAFISSVFAVGNRLQHDQEGLI